MNNALPSSSPSDLNIIQMKNSEDQQLLNFPDRKAVGALLFLSSIRRPGISFAINNFNYQHVNTVKRIIRYLIKTNDIENEYCNTSSLEGYSDVAYAGDVIDRRSPTGYIFIMNRGPISWCCEKQKTVSLFTTESFVAACSAAKEFLWLKQFLFEIDESNLKDFKLYYDSQS